MYFPWNYVGIYNRIKCTVFDYYPFNPTACFRAMDIFSRNRYPRVIIPRTTDLAPAALRKVRRYVTIIEETLFHGSNPIMDSDEIFKQR
jgi:hypothetical protein